MTPYQVALARISRSCRRWRWMPGMAYLRRGRPHRVDPNVLAAGRSYDHTCLPDLTDPATLGCLLALVREAWGNPRLVAIYCEAATPGQSEGWAVQAADNRLPVAGEDYATEAEALVAALEAIDHAERASGCPVGPQP